MVVSLKLLNSILINKGVGYWKRKAKEYQALKMVKVRVNKGISIKNRIIAKISKNLMLKAHGLSLNR